ncbi:2-phospho-L-lactate transferase [uncultured archaeon]|nr:2-phospho-L-lactate transferase [uncultured archaeon]
MIVLSGGTGTPKLLMGLKELVDPEDLSVVVNTAEDLWISGNLVSPDVDTVLYTLADIVDEVRWWGIRRDSFHTTGFLRTLGNPELLSLGDNDRAVHIFRSELIRQGVTLSSATRTLAKALGIKQEVLPMTDDLVSTMITTSDGEMHFQDFWVGLGGAPDVVSLRFRGIDKAAPCHRFLALLEKEDQVLIGPSNPVTSIGPILALPGVRERLKRKRIVAISPLVGNKPVSGPAAKFMNAVGVSADDDGVAELLGYPDVFVVDEDSGYRGDCVRLNTFMKDGEDSKRLARSIIELM